MRATQYTRKVPSFLLAGALLAALAACTPGSPGSPGSSATSGATSTPTPTGTATSTPTPTPTAAPPVEAAPFVIDCNSIIPQSRRDWLASSGWPLFPPADFFAKVRSEVPSSPYILMQDNGGTVCPHTTGFEVVVAYGYAPLAASQVAEAESLIAGTNDGYSPSSYAGGTLWDSPVEGNAFEFFLIVSDGIYVATTTEILDEMLATVP